MPQVKACVDQRYNVNARIGEVDEVVAKGAAIYAMNEAYTQAIQEYEEGERDSRPAPLRGDRAHVMNVTSKTYGLGIIDDQVGNVIFANSPLPTEVKTCEFSTNHDNQTGVNFNIYESDFTNPETDGTVDQKFCRLVTTETYVMPITGNYPKGTPIEIIFKIDNEGMLFVSGRLNNDTIDFDLKVTGVKSNDELAKAQNTLSRINIE